MAYKNRQKRLGKLSKPNDHALTFVVITAVLGFFTHLVYTRSGWMMNPDESELIATARLAAMPGGLNFNYTTSTYGPIWPEFLAILNHLGMTLDHFNAHRLALIMKIFIFLTPQYLAIKQMGLFKLSPVLIPLNFILFAPTSIEFSFLTSGLLPLAFMTAAIVVVKRVRHRFAVQTAGILFALAFMSKYQVALLSIILVYFIFQRSLTNGALDSRKFISDIIGFLLSIILTFSAFIIFLIQSQSFSKFFQESLLLSINYSTTQGFGGGANLLDKLSVGSSLLLGQPLLIISSLLMLFLAYVEMKSKPNFEVLRKKFSAINFSVLALLVFFALGFLTISIPGNGFPHYILFFLWALTAFLLTFEDPPKVASPMQRKSNSSENTPTTKFFNVATILIVMSMCLNIFVPAVKSYLNAPSVIESNQIRFEELSRSEILAYCPPKSQVLVWGWSSELFAYFDWNPPPNIVNDAARIRISQLSNNTISRLKSAVANRDTDCIYEAIGANFFGGMTLDEGVKSLPKDSLELLSLEYQQTTLGDGTSVWSRKR